MAEKKANFTWKNKFGIFVIILIVFFFLFDVASLSGIRSALETTDISDPQLNEVNRLLFKLFIFKFLELIILAGLSFGLIFWALKPYWDLVQKIINFAWDNPYLNASVKGMDEDIDRADRAVTALENLPLWKDEKLNSL